MNHSTQPRDQWEPGSWIPGARTAPVPWWSSLHMWKSFVVTQRGGSFPLQNGHKNKLFLYEREKYLLYKERLLWCTESQQCLVWYLLVSQYQHRSVFSSKKKFYLECTITDDSKYNFSFTAKGKRICSHVAAYFLCNSESFLIYWILKLVNDLPVYLVWLKKPHKLVMLTIILN